MKRVIVVAVAENGVIGKDGRVPWKMGSDMRHFRHLTMNHPVIMGRKTWQSLKQPLVGRDNIIVTSNPDFKAEGGHVVNSLEKAQEIAEEFAKMRGVEQIMIIGGADIYRQTLPHAHLIHMTEIHAQPEGDTFFPAIAQSDWREIARERHEKGRKDDYDYSFVTLERIAKPSK